VVTAGVQAMGVRREGKGSPGEKDGKGKELVKSNRLGRGLVGREGKIK